MSRLQRQRRMRRNKGGPQRILFLGFGLLLTGIAIAGISAVAWVVNVANSAPSLDANKLVQGDLNPSMDFRSIYSTILDKWLGMNPAPIVNGTYEMPAFLH